MENDKYVDKDNAKEMLRAIYHPTPKFGARDFLYEIRDDMRRGLPQLSPEKQGFVKATGPDGNPMYMSPTGQ